MTRLLARLILTVATVLAISAAAVPAALAQTLTPAPPATARCETSPSRTVCFWTEPFGTPGAVPYGVTCAGFSVRVNLTGERRFTAFYDDEGTLVRRVRHATYSGTLINSVTGAAVPHEGRFNMIEDFAAGTLTITGMLSRTVVPGEGLVWRNIGRIVLALQGGGVLFEAGEHGTWAVLAGDTSAAADLCASLE